MKKILKWWKFVACNRNFGTMLLCLRTVSSITFCKLTWKFIVDRGCVFLWKLVHSIAHQHARLSNAAVANKNALETPRRETFHVRANGRVVAVSRQRSALALIFPVDLKIHFWFASRHVLDWRRLPTEDVLLWFRSLLVPLWGLHRTSWYAGRRTVFATHSFYDSLFKKHFTTNKCSATASRFLYTQAIVEYGRMRN